MTSERTSPLLRYSGSLLRAITIALGVAAGYFMTVQSIRLELAAKAEIAVVSTLDKKLANFEVMLREGVVSRDQFYRFSKETETRLVRIEQYLKNQAGEKIEKQ